MLHFLQAASCGHTIVVYEIVLSLLRLIRTYAHSLHSAEWDMIYSILGVVQLHAARLLGTNTLMNVRKRIEHI